MAGRRFGRAPGLVAAALALAVLGLAGGCANRAADADGSSPDGASYGTLRPDGTLSNGLLPEPWGETN